MNAMLLDASQWLLDYYLLATVLLTSVLFMGRIVGQPARRIAIAWSAAAALLLGSACCAPCQAGRLCI